MPRREIIRSDFECKYEGDRKRKKKHPVRGNERLVEIMAMTNSRTNAVRAVAGDATGMSGELSLFSVSASDAT